MKTYTNLYLIRHAQAVVNVQPIVGGMKGDSGLTELGIQQANRLRDRLAATHEIAADVLIASTLPRARATAEIIAPALGLPIIWDDDVQEMRVGEADGMTNDEAWAKYGLPVIENNPFHRISPGGENWAEFVLRVGTTVSRITQEHQGKTIVVVCHGGFIDSAFFYFFNMGAFAPPAAGLYTHNTSITHWRQMRPADSAPGRWRLLGYNDVLHLRDIGVSESLNWQTTSDKLGRDGGHQSVPLPTEEE